MGNKPIVAALCAVLVSGCTTTLPTIPQDTLGQLKRVGVVSQAADQVSRQYVGLTVFGNEQDRRVIGDWNLDAEYEGQLAQAVSEVLHAQAVSMDAGRAAFAKVNSLNGPYSAAAFWGPNFDVIADPVKAACQDKSLDAIVVVGRTTAMDFFGKTNQSIEGLGVYGRRGVGGRVHVLAKLAVMDCKTSKPLATRWLQRKGEQGARSETRIPTAVVDAALASKPLAQWTDTESKQLRDQLASMPSSAWKDTLREMLPTP